MYAGAVFSFPQISVVQSRELFWGLMPSIISLFYLIAIAAMAAFIVGLAKHLRRYRRAAGAGIPVNWWGGIGRMISDIISHRTLRRRDRYSGVAHQLIFFGFVILLIGTAVITFDHDILHPLTGLSFWHGQFYLGFSLVTDVAGLMLIIGLLMMIARRAWFHLAKLDYVRRYRGDTEPLSQARIWRIEDWVFLGMLLAIAISGFVQEAVRLLMDRPPMGDLSPVGEALAAVLSSFGVDVADAQSIRRINWWIHGVLALTFIGSIAWIKSKHIIAALGSLAIRDQRSVARLPPVTQDLPASVQRVTDFSWRDMLHFDACTKCGRCHEACPARASGYPLSPRDLILDLRLLAQRNIDADVHQVISTETLWACRACGACAEICPVGIEHPAKIIKMRRALVDRGAMDPILRGVLETVANVGNSFGEPARKRGTWTRELEFQVKDARKESVKALWFVGDFASFDPRSQQVSRTVARIFRAAGLDFGILYDAERTAGNDVRRTGEEGLFEALREHNTQAFSRLEFDWIVTTDPHSFNTLRNEYDEAFGERNVWHYTNVLAEWLESGRLKVNKPLLKRVTLHDPCHLGRLNKQYDAPRRVLRAIGCEIVEMPRSRDNSFCCGAGGGRIWVPDAPGSEKPAHSRMHEAAQLDRIDVFVTCCPKDLTMFEDARKGSGHEEDFVVADIAELVAEAIELKAIPPDYLPQLAERIAQNLAEQVCARLVPQLINALGTHLHSGSFALARPHGLTEEPVNHVAVVPAPSSSESPIEWVVEPFRPARLVDYERPTKEGVRILVAVKHVGKLGDEFEFEDKSIKVSQNYLEYQLNEFDETALEAAVQLVEQLGQGEVVAVTIGDEQAEASLRKALAKGAHRGVRVWSDELWDSDPVSVAACLAGVTELESPDLVLTGVQSGDFGNGSTASALGGMLRWPHAAVVVGLSWSGHGRIDIVRELEGGVRHKQSFPSPAVLSIQAGANTPRYATMRMIKEAKVKPVAQVSLAEIPTKGSVVNQMLKPPVGQARMIEGSVSDIAAQITNIIRECRGG